jgi:hypothetical protein
LWQFATMVLVVELSGFGQILPPCSGRAGMRP